MWSSAQTHDLGRDPRPPLHTLQTQCNILSTQDAGPWTSVSSAIAALNDGTLIVSQGLCVLFSSSKGSYWLLYRADMKKECDSIISMAKSWTEKGSDNKTKCTEISHDTGTHAVITKWYHGVSGNHICGTGPERTHLVVHKAGGDQCTGFIICAEGSVVEMSDVSFSNPEGVPYGMFMWKNSKLLCERVHFKGGTTPAIMALDEGCEVQLVDCVFDSACSMHLDHKTSQLSVMRSTGTQNLVVSGAARQFGLGTYSAGIHAVVTKWYHGTDGNKISGAGSERSHLVVNKAGGDQCTGFVICAEGAVVEISDVSFSNPEGVPHGMFMWKNSKLLCQRVHFKGGTTPAITAHDERCTVQLVDCVFDPACTMSIGHARSQLCVVRGTGRENLAVSGAAEQVGLDDISSAKRNYSMLTPARALHLSKNPAAPISLVRRPSRRVQLITKVKVMQTAFTQRAQDQIFFFVPQLLGCTNDGSSCQGNGQVSLWRTSERGERKDDVARVPGTKSLVGTITSWDEVEGLRAQHDFTMFETRLVLKEELEHGTCEEVSQGWSVVTPHQLSARERKLALNTISWGTGDDCEAMLHELSSRGLCRDGMRDLLYVQKLATEIPGKHIVYNAGKDFEVNNGKPPSHAFKTGVGQCGRFSEVLTMACRVSGIPARNVLNNPRFGDGDGEQDIFDPCNMHCCCEVYIDGAGWVFIEPQNGILGQMAPNYFLTSAPGVPCPNHFFDRDLLRDPMDAKHVEWAFNTFDKDHNDHLDRDEATNFLAQLFGMPTIPDPLGDHGAASSLLALVESLDYNHDGLISKDELMQALNSGPLAEWSNSDLFVLGQSTIGAVVLVETRTTYPAGTHAVVTKWYHGAQGNEISGSGIKHTQLVVDEAGGDQCTGFVICAEGAVVEISDLSFSSPEAVPCGMFMWKNSSLLCRRVHFKGGKALAILADQEGCTVQLEGCVFDPGCRMHIGHASSNLHMVSCSGEANLIISGSVHRSATADSKFVGSTSQCSPKLPSTKLVNISVTANVRLRRGLHKKLGVSDDLNSMRPEQIAKMPMPIVDQTYARIVEWDMDSDGSLGQVLVDHSAEKL